MMDMEQQLEQLREHSQAQQTEVIGDELKEHID